MSNHTPGVSQNTSRWILSNWFEIHNFLFGAFAGSTPDHVFGAMVPQECRQCLTQIFPLDPRIGTSREIWESWFSDTVAQRWAKQSNKQKIFDNNCLNLSSLEFWSVILKLYLEQLYEASQGASFQVVSWCFLMWAMLFQMFPHKWHPGSWGRVLLIDGPLWSSRQMNRVIRGGR